MEVTYQDIIRSNTLLYATEMKMPKALGEFGKSKYGDVTHTILEILEHAHSPQSIQMLWKKVSKDLTKFPELVEIMKGLLQAERVQQVTVGKTTGFLPMKKVETTWDETLLEHDWLTEEEWTT